MKKSSVNTFTEGLVCDLDPINVPNNVLTDCLNGTIITYDDNEFSLQNDKGNYPLSNCKLKENFIPLGIKEYGGIIYIISYNPITDEEEIGTYPSPKMKSVNSSGELCVDHIINGSFESSNEIDYKVILSKIKNLYFSNPELKLNVGDVFKFKEQEIGSDDKYESIEYSVIDDNLKEHVIDSSWKHKNKYIAKNSGVICVKNKVIELESNNVTTKSFICTKDINSEDKALTIISLLSEIDVDDWLLLKCINEGDIPIGYRVKVSCKGTIRQTIDIPFISDDKQEFETISFSYSNGIVQDWYGNNKTLTKTVKIIVKDLDMDDSISVDITPIIYYDFNKLIIYSDLNKSTTFNISEFVSGQWSVAKNRYKFYTDDDNQYIEIDVQGPLEANDELTLHWSVWDGLNDNIVSDLELGDVGIGINTLIIPYSNNLLKRESAYGIKFQLKCSSEVVWSEFSNEKYRALLTTELYNDLYSLNQNSDEVDFSNWWNKFSLQDKGSVSINNAVNNKPLPTTKWEYFGEWSEDILNSDKAFPNHVSRSSKLDVSNLSNSKIGPDIRLNGAYYSCNISAEYPKRLHGDLWSTVTNLTVNDVLGKTIVKYTDNDSNNYNNSWLKDVPSGVGINVNYLKSRAVVGNYDGIESVTTGSYEEFGWHLYIQNAWNSIPYSHGLKLVTPVHSRPGYITIASTTEGNESRDNLTDAAIQRAKACFSERNGSDFITSYLTLRKIDRTLSTSEYACVFKNSPHWDNLIAGCNNVDKPVSYDRGGLCESDEYMFASIPEIVIPYLKKINASSLETFKDGFWVGIEPGDSINFNKLILNATYNINVTPGYNSDYYNNCSNNSCLTPVNTNIDFSTDISYSKDIGSNFSVDVISDSIDEINNRLSADKSYASKIPTGTIGSYVKGIIRTDTNSYYTVGNLSENYRLHDKIIASGTPTNSYYLGRYFTTGGSIWNPVDVGLSNINYIAEYE